jgi:hypothetical protein
MALLDQPVSSPASDEAQVRYDTLLTIMRMAILSLVSDLDAVFLEDPLVVTKSNLESVRGSSIEPLAGGIGGTVVVEPKATGSAISRWQVNNQNDSQVRGPFDELPLCLAELRCVLALLFLDVVRPRAEEYWVGELQRQWDC